MDHITLYICTVNVLHYLAALIVLKDNYHYMILLYISVNGYRVILYWLLLYLLARLLVGFVKL